MADNITSRKRLISVLIPTCNEVGNIEPFIHDVLALFDADLAAYDYEIVVIDNDSTDGTRDILRRLCAGNPKIKCVFNIRNYGSIRSGFHGLRQVSGDCCVKVAADFQEPVELIPSMVREWEKGAHVVVGVKSDSEESKVSYGFRQIFYNIIHRNSEFEQIDQFTGFGLFDRSFLEVCARLDDPYPYFRGIVSELGGKWKALEYKQVARKSGISKYNFARLYDYGMLGITTYSKVFLRSATFVAGFMGVVSVLCAIVLVILAIAGVSFPSALPIIDAMAFFTAILLFFIGILGEYVLVINQRLLKRPLVVEEERINF